MKKISYIILTLVLILGIAGLAKNSWAATYWVSPTGSATSKSSCLSTSDPGGGDSNYCTIFGYWGIGRTQNTLSPGDIVMMKGGVYSSVDDGIAPQQSGSAGTPITFKAADTGNPPIISVGIGAAGILLQYVSYIKIDGIHVDKSNTPGLIRSFANHNEITNCTFSNSGTFFMWGSCGDNYNCPVTHNWIHGNTFSKGAGGSGACGNEGMDLIRLGPACCSVGIIVDPEDNYNTIEDNYMEYGGHSIIDAFGRFTVFRNNITHNEPWYSAIDNGTSCIFPATGYTNSAYDGKWGHRNIQFDDDWGRPALYNLIEGNRIGYGGVNPDNAGADGLDVAGPKQIIRYNSIYGVMNMGLYFKYGSGIPGQPGGNGAGGWGGVYNRVFNNTVYHNGYGYPYYETCTLNVCPADEAGIVAGVGSFGNVLKNNLTYQNRSYTKAGADIINQWGGSPVYPPKATVVNNWETGNGDPKFTNPDLNDPTSRILPDLSLQSSSPAIDGGAALTTAKGSGSNSTTLVVDDALYFQDGSWGSDLARGVTLFPDWIAIGTVNNTVQIALGGINYSTNTITLASPMTWSNGASIWLYKKSDGKQILYGSEPDYGAYEYGQETSVIYGDVSGDGKVTAYDAALVAQAAVGLISFTADKIKAGDVDGNHSIAAYDAALIAQYAVGLISSFPVEG